MGIIETKLTTKGVNLGHREKEEGAKWKIWFLSASFCSFFWVVIASSGQAIDYGGDSMDWPYLISGLIALGLLMYLFWALLKPEDWA